MYKSELDQYFKQVEESQKDPTAPKPEALKVINICEERGDFRIDVRDALHVPMGKLLKDFLGGNAPFSSRERVVLASGGDERARIAANYLRGRGYNVEPLEG